jgi:transcriptional regulator with XRE-family HTH domain
MTARQRHRTGQLPEAEAAVVAVNIRTLRRRNGWTQAELGELMGWPNASTVCAAEGRRGGRQRGFTAREVRQLAAIFGVPSGQLTAQCANCNGQPPEGFACLACGASDRGRRTNTC